MLVLNLPFKALMFLTLMRPSLVLFLVLWLKLVKDFLKVRCRLALLDRKSGSAGMPRPISYAVFCLKKKKKKKEKKLGEMIAIDIEMSNAYIMENRYGR